MDEAGLPNAILANDGRSSHGCGASWARQGFEWDRAYAVWKEAQEVLGHI